MKVAAFWIGVSLFLVMVIFFWMASRVPGPLDLRQARKIGPGSRGG